MNHIEIPFSLKTLYRHWKSHTIPIKDQLSSEQVCLDNALFSDLQSFIHSRITIWDKKTRGEAAPYTTDEVLSKYRFCNIFREFDRQTIEFHTMLVPLRDDFSVWLLNMFYFRMVARTSTVEYAGLLSFDAQENSAVYKRLMGSPRPRFGTPYVFPVSTIMRSEYPARELFITQYLPTVMQAIASEIRTWDKQSVYDGVQQILPIFGYNHTFLWTEVLIDVAYQYPQHIDLFARFPIGPGSAPTMSRIDSKRDPTMLVTELACIPLDTGITYDGTPLRLSAENWEGIGCEFRKYTNLMQGKGRKRLFRTART